MKKINLIKTNRFKVVNFTLTFILPFKKEYIPSTALLNTLLVKTSEKYKKNIELTKELQNLYNANISSSYTVSGNLFLIDYTLEFICPKYTEKSMYNKTFKLFREILFKPNVINGAFSKKEFEMYKTNIINNIASLKEQNEVLAESNYNKIMFKGLPYEHTPLSLQKLYKELTPKSLYAYYKEVFNSSYIINVIGDFDETEINKQIKSITKHLIKEESVLPNIKLKETKNKGLIEKKDTKKSNQSTLLIGYIFNNLTDFERKYVLTFYNLILGSMNNSVLFVNVREKCSLCYGISSYIHRFVPSITIECGINKDNYTLAVEEVLKSVELMKNKNEINKLYENALNTINLSLNDYDEDVSKILHHHIFKEFEESDDIDTRRKKFKEVKVEDIINLNKKMSLKTIYFQEGTNEND